MCSLAHLSSSVHHKTSSFPFMTTGKSWFFPCLIEFDLVVIVCTFFNWRTKRHHRVSTERRVLGWVKAQKHLGKMEEGGQVEEKGWQNWAHRGHEELEGQEHFVLPTNTKLMNRKGQPQREQERNKTWPWMRSHRGQKNTTVIKQARLSKGKSTHITEEDGQMGFKWMEFSWCKHWELCLWKS